MVPSNEAKNYELLEKLMETLEAANEENLQSFHSAIERARIVESKAVQYLTQVTEKISKWKNHVADLVYKLKLKRKEVLVSDEYRMRQSMDRRDYLEIETSSLDIKIIEAKAKIDSLQLFRDAILRVVTAARNSRADIAKKLKVVEIQYNLSEIDGGAHHA